MLHVKVSYHTVCVYNMVGNWSYNHKLYHHRADMMLETKQLIYSATTQDYHVLDKEHVISYGHKLEHQCQLLFLSSKEAASCENEFHISFNLIFKRFYH